MKINLKYANKEVDQVLIDLSKVSTVTLDVHNKYKFNMSKRWNGERKSSFHLSGKIEIEKWLSMLTSRSAIFLNRLTLNFYFACVLHLFGIDGLSRLPLTKTKWRTCNMRCVAKQISIIFILYICLIYWFIYINCYIDNIV